MIFFLSEFLVWCYKKTKRHHDWAALTVVSSAVNRISTDWFVLSDGLWMMSPALSDRLHNNTNNNKHSFLTDWLIDSGNVCLKSFRFIVSAKCHVREQQISITESTFTDELLFFSSAQMSPEQPSSTPAARSYFCVCGFNLLPVTWSQADTMDAQEPLWTRRDVLSPPSWHDRAVKTQRHQVGWQGVKLNVSW